MSDPPTTTMPIPPTEPTKRRWLLPTLGGVGAFVGGLLTGPAARGDHRRTNGTHSHLHRDRHRHAGRVHRTTSHRGGTTAGSPSR